MRRLYVHYEDSLVGVLTEDDDGVQSFAYDKEWCGREDRFSLSLALRVRSEPYRGKVVESFFENLLPEGAERRRIEVLAGLPAGDDIAFLERFGDDCAGALSLSVHADSAGTPATPVRPETRVGYEAIAKALAEGLPIQSVLEPDGDLPPFSLAGAQAKFPCIVRDGSIALPARGEPTSHIIKLPIRAGEKLLDSVQNEFLCMRLAALVGLDVPHVDIVGSAETPLLAVVRFDRKVEDGRVRRLHTQDFCQALGRTSREKYERHGGPTFADCFRLTKDESTEPAHDLLDLLDWVAFNLVIGNNDSHAKNLSLILDDGRVRLAPFYDLVCTAAYPQYDRQFAFRIGDVSSWEKIGPAKVETFARLLGLKSSYVRSRWLALFARAQTAFEDVATSAGDDANLAKSLRKIRDESSKRLKELGRRLAAK